MSGADSDRLVLIAEPPAVAEAGSFRVVMDADVPSSAEASAQAAEAAAKELAVLLGLEALASESTRDILVFELRDSFVEAARAFSNDQEAIAGTYIHWPSSTVLVQAGPGMSSEAAAVLGPSQFLLRSVSAQAANVEGRRLIPAWRDLPDWLREGLTTIASQRALESLGMVPPPIFDPLIAGAISKAPAQDLGRLGNLTEPPPTRAWVRDVLAGEETGAIAYFPALVEEFMKSLEDKDGFVASLRQVPGGPRAETKINELVAETITEDSPRVLRDAMGARFLAFSQGWVQQGALIEVDPMNTFAVQLRALDQSNVIAWRAGSENPQTVSGEATIVGVGPLQANVVLAQGGGGLVAINFAGGQGVAISRFDPRARSWNTIAGRRWEIPADEAFRFSVLPGDGVVTVRVGGEDVLRAEGLFAGVPAGDRAWSAWGVGAQAGSAARFVMDSP